MKFLFSSPAALISAAFIAAQLPSLSGAAATSPPLSVAAALLVGVFPERVALTIGITALITAQLAPIWLQTPLSPAPPLMTLYLAAIAGLIRYGASRWNTISWRNSLIAALCAAFAVGGSHVARLHDVTTGGRPGIMTPGLGGPNAPLSSAALMTLGASSLPAGAPLLIAGAVGLRQGLPDPDAEQRLWLNEIARQRSPQPLGTAQPITTVDIGTQILQLLPVPQTGLRTVLLDMPGTLDVPLTLRGYQIIPARHGADRESQRVIRSGAVPFGVTIASFDHDPGIARIRRLMAASATTLIVTPLKARGSVTVAMRKAQQWRSGPLLLSCEGALCPGKPLQFKGQWTRP